MSRYSPPPGRRAPPTERSSTGTLSYAFNDPSYTRVSRDSYAQPKPSATTSRVVPISTETFVGGVPVSTIRHEGYHDYTKQARRTTYRDVYPESRSSVSGAASSSTSRSTALPDRSVASSSSRAKDQEYRDYYDAPISSSSRAGHKKRDSVDDTRPLRRPDDRERVSRRHEDFDRPYTSKSSRQPYPDEEGNYEYMDPGRMYSETEPQYRPQRRGSVGGGKSRDVRADRRSSVIDQYPQRTTARGEGPPPVTRGLDKVNESHDRRSSLRDSGPSRRTRGYGSQDEEDDYQDGYRVAPRKPIRRADAREEVRDLGRPPRRDDFDDYDDRADRQRGTRRYEDPEVSKRGFGIRTGDLDPSYDDRDFDRERRSSYDLGSSRTGGSREDDLTARGKGTGVRDRDPYDDRAERAGRRREEVLDDRKTRDEDVQEPARRKRAPEEFRPARDRDEVLDERSDRYEDVDRKPNPRRGGRETSDEYSRGSLDDSRRGEDPSIGKAIAGTAALGAGGYAADEILDRRRRDRDRGDDEGRGSERDNRTQERPRAGERPEDDDEPQSRARRVPDDESPDIEKSRRRQYITKDDLNDEGMRDRGPQPIDPDEEYRQRIRLEAEKVKQAQADSGANDEGSDRDRRRRDREDRKAKDRQEPRVPPALGREASSFDPDGQALTPYGQPPGAFNEEPLIRDPDELDSRKVRVVEAPERKEAPKGILRKPTDKFPDHPNQVREGVAPLKAVEGVPSDARWTKINRSKVNPQTLTEAGERFEERRDFVVVLRVVPRDQIDKWAERTDQIRDERYKRHQRERRRLKERGEQSSSGSEDFEEGHHTEAARRELE